MEWTCHPTVSPCATRVQITGAHDATMGNSARWTAMEELTSNLRWRHTRGRTANLPCRLPCPHVHAPVPFTQAETAPQRARAREAVHANAPGCDMGVVARRTDTCCVRGHLPLLLWLWGLIIGFVWGPRIRRGARRVRNERPETRTTARRIGKCERKERTYVELVGDGVLLVPGRGDGRPRPRPRAEPRERVVRRQPRVPVERQVPRLHSTQTAGIRMRSVSAAAHSERKKPNRDVNYLPWSAGRRG